MLTAFFSKCIKLYCLIEVHISIIRVFVMQAYQCMYRKYSRFEIEERTSSVKTRFHPSSLRVLFFSSHCVHRRDAQSNNLNSVRISDLVPFFPQSFVRDREGSDKKNTEWAPVGREYNVEAARIYIPATAPGEHRSLRPLCGCGRADTYYKRRRNEIKVKKNSVGGMQQKKRKIGLETHALRNDNS